MESEANAEVDRIMEELTADVLSKADPVPTKGPPVKQAQQQEEVVEQQETEKVRRQLVRVSVSVCMYVHVCACVCAGEWPIGR